MSRYATPDFDKYEPKPVEDIDVPDFDLPDPPVVEMTLLNEKQREYNRLQSQLADALVAAIDPAEHAAHALIQALTTIEQEIVTTQDLERARFLQTLIGRHTTHAQAVEVKAWQAVDRCMERRR